MKKNSKLKKKTDESGNGESITRKEAIRKTGKYAAITAASMLLLLSSKESPAASLPTSPGSGWPTT